MNEDIARPAVFCGLFRIPDMCRRLFDLVHQCNVMIPGDLCKRRLHNFISGETRCELCHIFEIPDGIPLHLREGELDICGEVFNKLAAPDLVRIDNAPDGVIQPQQFAVHLNRCTILCSTNFLLHLLDGLQILT